MTHYEEIKELAHAHRKRSTPVEGLLEDIRRKRQGLGSSSGHWYALSGAIVLAGLGSILTYIMNIQWSLIDAFYWTVITMTTVGYGDMLTPSAHMKLFAVFFMPIATAALAISVQEISITVQRKRISDKQLNLIADKVMLSGLRLLDKAKAKVLGEAALSRDTSLNEEQFILSALISEGIIDQKMVVTLRNKFKDMLWQHNRCFPEKDRKQAMDPELVYFLLKQQGRVIDHSSPITNHPNIYRVDIWGNAFARLPGFEEWLLKHWRASQISNAAKQIQHHVRMRNSSSNLLKEVKEEEKKSPSLASSKKAKGFSAPRQQSKLSHPVRMSSERRTMHATVETQTGCGNYLLLKEFEA